MISLIEIYLMFFKISSVTFGGGMAMLPILQRDIVQTNAWVTDEEIINFYALSQGIPGIIAVNVAAFIGYRKRGVLGLIVAALGIVSPCTLIIIILATFIDKFQDIKIVKQAFSGISVGVTALIFDSVFNLWKKSVKDYMYILLYSISLALMILTKISPVIYVLASGIITIIIKNSEEKS